MNSKVRVLLVSSCDGLSALPLKGILKNELINIVGIAKVSISTRTKFSILRSAFVQNSFLYALYIQVEAIIGSLYASNCLSPFLFQRLSLYNQIPIETITSLADTQLPLLIAKYKPDILLSIRPGLIFKNNVISKSPPILNLHCSMLPSYGGIGAVLQALAAGESELGISLHKIDNEQIDSGEVVAQMKVAVRSRKSVLWHTLKLYSTSSELVMNTLHFWPYISKAYPKSISSNHSYFSWPKKYVFNNLRQNGHKLISLSDVFSAITIIFKAR